jgi:cell division protein ZapA
MRLNTYRSHYKNLELEKIIAMVAYEFSLENQKLKQRNDTEPYSKKIDELTDLLEEYFRKE